MTPIPFSRTTRALAADGRRLGWLGLVALALVGGWGAWFGLARVTVYKVSPSARLEVIQQAHGVAPLVEGRIVEISLAIGQSVAAGELLARLDSETQRLAIASKTAQSEALEARLAAEVSEVEAETNALAEDQQALQVALVESQAQLEEAEPRLRLAEANLARSVNLLARKAISKEEYDTFKAEADFRQAALRTLATTKSRIEQDGAVRRRDRQTRIARLTRERVELEGELKMQRAAIRQLDHEIELRTIRAPVAGMVGEVMKIPVGSVVRVGEKLGSIVPTGEARVVAMFPVEVAGRLRPNQEARLRLTGFPWTQYGTVAAVVQKIAREPGADGLRVELAVRGGDDFVVPLEHGLPCSVEVAVEQVSPLILTLRAVGQLLVTKERTTTSPPPL